MWSLAQDSGGRASSSGPRNLSVPHLTPPTSGPCDIRPGIPVLPRHSGHPVFRMARHAGPGQAAFVCPLGGDATNCLRDSSFLKSGALLGSLFPAPPEGISPPFQVLGSGSSYSCLSLGWPCTHPSQASSELELPRQGLLVCG